MEYSLYEHREYVGVNENLASEPNLVLLARTLQMNWLISATCESGNSDYSTPHEG